MSNLYGIPASGLDGLSPVIVSSASDPAQVARLIFPAGGVALIMVDLSGRVIFSSPDVLALAAGGPGGVADNALQDVFPALNLPPAGSSGDADLSIRCNGNIDLYRVNWTWVPSQGWIGVVALAVRQPEPLLSPGLRRDELTGLGDRASLRPTFDSLRVRSGAAPSTLTAACIDLDRFKAVNDTLGHAAGDDLLRKVAKRLTSSVREGDDVIRMGGDEFTILFPDCADDDVEAMALRIVDVIRRPFVVQGHQVIIGASIGLAHLGPDETDPQELLRRADVALYRSKHAGRGCFTWFEEGMFTALDDRRTIETDLRKALLLDQFVLTYQSQFSFDTGSITGFEALVRWLHPERGTISPADFIPIAEETGMILQIGAWVLEEACRTAMSWPAYLHIAVNVSPVQFEANGFVESVRTALAATGLPPQRLELELTESVLLTEDEIVLDRMQALRQLGVRLSLDDFGTGYSSLNYLRKYPFDKVKIDQSFVREPFADENAHRIVTAVAGLGAAMGMSVIAEGVETEAQLDRIRSQGCSAAQGYLLSRPISAGDIAAYLTKVAQEAGSTTTAIPDEEPTRC